MYKLKKITYCGVSDCICALLLIITCFLLAGVKPALSCLLVDTVDSEMLFSGVNLLVIPEL